MFIPEPTRCPGCESLDYARRDIPSDAPGVTVHLVPNPEPLAKRMADDDAEE